MKKRVQVPAFFLGLFLTAGFCLQAQETPDSEQVIAEVGGQKLTLVDLQQQQGGKLLQARYQYYMNQRKALDQLLVLGTLLEASPPGRKWPSVRDARALVDLMAPDTDSDTVRRLAKSAQTDRELFGTVQLAGDEPADPAETDEAWAHVREGTVSLREAMRSDLGLHSAADDDKPGIPG